MSSRRPQEPKPAVFASVRNPYIENFCKLLMEKRGEKLEPEAFDQVLDEMYLLYESMLGRNMLEALPEDLRSEYLALAKDPGNLTFEKIAAIFSKNPLDYEQIMKQTMKEFTEIYLKNRQFEAEDFLVTSEVL